MSLSVTTHLCPLNKHKHSVARNAIEEGRTVLSVRPFLFQSVSIILSDFPLNVIFLSFFIPPLKLQDFGCKLCTKTGLRSFNELL